MAHPLNTATQTWLSVGGVLKTSGPADFKSVPGFEIDQDLWE